MSTKPTKFKTAVLAGISAAAMLSSVQANAANVAIATGGFFTSNLTNQLTAFGHTVTEVASYSAASLAGFNAIITYGNMNSADFAELEAFAMAGGTVVETPWFWLNYSPTPNLDIFTQGGSTSPNNLPLLGLNFSELNPGVTVLDAGNPLLNGVLFPAAGTVAMARTIGNGFASGVNQIALWADDGTAFIGEKTLGAGRVVGINLHVITSDTPYYVIDEQWAATLLSNAVSLTPTPVPVPAAVWLLGSALMGMVGASRRKATAEA